jgi:predicted DNA-binding antitoxin AbrB/MazE fold protein
MIERVGMCLLSALPAMAEGATMSTEARAIYEDGVLRLLTPVALPERAEVRIQILTEQEAQDELKRAEAALIAAGLVKPKKIPEELEPVSSTRRAELARLYAVGGPLSESIIAERDAR